jgi:hypothetical protein
MSTSCRQALTLAISITPPDIKKKEATSSDGTLEGAVEAGGEM